MPHLPAPEIGKAQAQHGVLHPSHTGNSGVNILSDDNVNVKDISTPKDFDTA
jgi:hypothetical protein